MFAFVFIMNMLCITPNYVEILSHTVYLGQ